MITRINPSRNEYDAENKRKYGYVIRVPKLPDAHEGVEGFTVFNLEDNCFYKCKPASKTGAYEWVRVTFGATRSYLIPVNKLTLLDRESIAPLNSKNIVDVETLGRTINEIIVGLRRYNVDIEPLGYVHVADGMFADNTKYYQWKWTNLEATVVDYRGHKIFVGDFVEMKAGTEYEVSIGKADYVVGTKIPTDQVFEPAKGGWTSVTTTDFVTAINAIANVLNTHEAGIPKVYVNDIPGELCRVVNLIIDEVNPFAIPWQILIDRVLVVEQQVGPNKLSSTSSGQSVNLAKWDAVTWNNYAKDELGPLYFGTVCEVTDSTLSVLQQLDTKIGDLSQLVNIEDRTLAEWVNDLYNQIDGLVLSTQRSLRGIKQLWDTLGEDIGFAAASGTFSDEVTYYTFSTTDYYFKELKSGDEEGVAAGKADYYPGMEILDYKPATGYTGVYLFCNGEYIRNPGSSKIVGMQGTVRAMVDMINKLLGYELYPIKIETLSSTAEKGVAYYTFTSTDDQTVGVFNTLNVAAGDDLDAIRNTVGPVFVDVTASTVVKQIDLNNKEIARGAARYHEVKQLITGLRGDLSSADDDVSWLRKTTGVAAGNQSKHAFTYDEATSTRTTNWVVDGYEKCSDTEYNKDRDYYALDQYHYATKKYPCGDEPVYRQSTDTETYTYYTYDMDTCSWTKITPATHKDDDGIIRCNRNDLWIEAKSDYINQGMIRLVPGTLDECSNGTANYVIPYYYQTADANFVTDKDYYCYDTTTSSYVKLTVNVEYVNGEEIGYNKKYNSKVYEYTNPTPVGTIYPPHLVDEQTGVVTSTKVTVFTRRTVYANENTHRGLIDRNTEGINAQRDRASKFQKWTETKFDNLEQYVTEMLLVTIDLITQEVSTLSILHERLDKLINLHNAMERLGGTQTWKVADDKYESGFDYYLKRNGEYYKMSEGGLDPELSYEIGNAVVPNVYTKDIVITRTENYTLDDIRIALNRILRVHIESGELPEYTALPTDTVILESMTYWRWDGEKWDDIVPERDDKYMIGKTIGSYDQDHTWYIKFQEITPDDINTYSETPVRVYFNELVKLHRKSS